MRRRYQPAMTRVGQTSTNGVLFRVPDIGVRRRDAQRHVSVVGQLHLLQNNGVTALFSLIGVCTRSALLAAEKVALLLTSFT